MLDVFFQFSTQASWLKGYYIMQSMDRITADNLAILTLFTLFL